MEEEMFDYDFELFKKKNDSVIDKSRLASKPANMDIFKNFEELDTFEVTDEDIEFEQTLVDGYQDLIDEAREKKNSLIEELFESDMENTMEIDNFHDEILSEIENMENNKQEKALEVDEKEEKKPMTMEAAFIYCSILGFIIMIFGYEWFYYIMHSIQ